MTQIFVLSIADKAIGLLEQHSVHLEMLVAMRTAGLEKKKKNWENLLKELFPRYYIPLQSVFIDLMSEHLLLCCMN